MSGESEKTPLAYAGANASVRKIILAHAEKRVESFLDRLTSIDQRLTGLSALMFAGSAIAATIIVGGDKIPVVALWFAGFAALLFTIGGIVSLRGIESAHGFLPGERPSWWEQGGATYLHEMTMEIADALVAQHYEDVINGLDNIMNNRANALNRSLYCGAAAGVLIAVAAVSTALYSKPLDPRREAHDCEYSISVKIHMARSLGEPVDPQRRHRHQCALARPIQAKPL